MVTNNALFVLSLIVWSKQHVIYYQPLDFCAMAQACEHDGVAICACAGPCGCRNFLDQCDMYEFNCDYGTAYQKEGCEAIPPCVTTTTAATTTEAFEDYIKRHSPTIKTFPIYSFYSNCGNCGRPKTWKTTAIGERRDFFRILSDDTAAQMYK